LRAFSAAFFSEYGFHFLKRKQKFDTIKEKVFDLIIIKHNGGKKWKKINQK